MNRCLAIPLAVAVPGCAAAERSDGGGFDRSPTRETVLFTTPDGETRNLMITRENLVSRATVLAPRRIVWNALPDAFSDVGLPLPGLDSGRGMAGVQSHRILFRLGQERLSRFFDCGMGPTGLNADQRALRVSVFVAVLQELEGATPVEVRAEAVSQSTEGASTQVMSCSSSGVLEQRLTTALQLRTLQANRN
jgi:hypothetical protein